MKKFAKSFSYAAKGIRHAFSHERNFRIESAIALLVLAASFLLPLSPMERVAVILTIGLVLSLELLNSAVEWLMDVLQPEYHESVKIVKDLSAAAVLIISIFAALVGVVIFLPHVLALVS
jgi:diacylglycerol kinase